MTPERVSDERLAELAEGWEHQATTLIHDCSLAGSQYAETCRNTAAALRELQQWRSGIEPSTGHPIGKLVVMETWMEET